VYFNIIFVGDRFILLLLRKIYAAIEKIINKDIFKNISPSVCERGTLNNLIVNIGLLHRDDVMLKYRSVNLINILQSTKAENLNIELYFICFEL